MRTIVSSAAVLAATALLIAAAPASAKTRGCVPASAKLVSSTNGVRLYTTGVSRSTEIGAQSTWVCSDSTGKRARIAKRTIGPRSFDGEVASLIRISGRRVAVAVQKHDGFDGGGLDYDAYVRRVDLTDGSVQITDVCPDCRRSDRAVGTDNPNPRIKITSLVLNSRGYIAWILHDGRRDYRFSVGRHDSRGIAVLDRSPDIEPGSLATVGTTLYWIARGAPQDEDIF
jgi:hypothetical protein